MQRPATIRHRTSLFEEATAIVEAEYASDLSLDDIARRVASVAPPAAARVRRDRPHDLPRAPDRGADGARRRACSRSRGADRARGRPPRRLPPAGAVRQGVPPPPRRLALELPRRARPAARASATARASPPSPPEAAAERCRRQSSVTYRVALCRGRPIGCRRACRRRARRGRERKRTGPADGRRRRHRLRDRHRHRPQHQLVPAGRLDAGRQDRHALGRPDHRLGAGLRARHGGRPASRSSSSACARARRTSTARRSTATRGSRSSGPRSRRSSSSASCTYAYVVLRDIEKAPAGRQRARRRTSPASSSPGRFDYNEGGKTVHAPRSSTCPRASR